MIAIPSVYFAIYLGKKGYAWYYSKNPSFIKPHLSYRDSAKLYIASLIGDVLNNPAVEKDGLNFLDRLFREPQTKQAGLVLMSNVLSDPRFVHESKDFSTDLISHVIRQPDTQEDFKKLMIKTLRDEHVK